MKPTKDTFLKAICILYFIFGGIGVFFHLTTIFYVALIDIISGIPYLSKLHELMMVGGTIYSFIALIINIAALYGVYRILHHEKIGLYIFISSQIALLLAPYVFIITPVVDITPLITIVFLPNIVITLILLLLFLKYKDMLH